jgi:hypothetical protein
VTLAIPRPCRRLLGSKKDDLWTMPLESTLRSPSHRGVQWK